MSQKIFEVKGLQAQSRITQVEDTLRSIRGVQTVHVSPGAETVEIEYDSMQTDPVTMKQALAQQGIEAADWPPED